jgi:DNA-binding MarR family transcriptional regulator
MSDQHQQLLEQIHKLIMEFSLQARQEYSDLMQPFALTLSQFVVLALLQTVNRPLSLREISDHTLIPPSSMTHTIDRLVEQNLVLRAAHPTDRRTILASLTDEGRSIVERIDQERRAIFERTWGQLPETELSTFTEILNKIIPIYQAQNAAGNHHHALAVASNGHSRY